MDQTREDPTILRRAALVASALAFGAAAAIALAGAHPSPRVRADASSLTALQLADKALSGSTLLEDEGRYRLIDPVGPGGITTLAARDEVFSPIMIGGRYSGYNPVRDPFEPPQENQQYPPIPYGPPREEIP